MKSRCISGRWTSVVICLLVGTALAICAARVSGQTQKPSKNEGRKSQVVPDASAVTEAEAKVKAARNKEIAEHGKPGNETARALEDYARKMRTYASEFSREDDREQQRVRARAIAEEACRLFEEIKSWSKVAECKKLMAAIYRESSKLPEAHRLIDEAMTVYESKGLSNRSELASLHYEFGLILHAMRQAEGARQHFEKGLAAANEAIQDAESRNDQRDLAWARDTHRKLKHLLDPAGDIARPPGTGSRRVQRTQDIHDGRRHAIRALRTAMSAFAGPGTDLAAARGKLNEIRDELRRAKKELESADNACRNDFGPEGYQRHVDTARVKRGLAVVALGEALLAQTREEVNNALTQGRIPSREGLRDALLKNVNTREALALAREALEVSLRIIDDAAARRTSLEQLWHQDDLEEYLSAYLSLVTVFGKSATLESDADVYALLMAWKGSAFTRRAILSHIRAQTSTPGDDTLRHELLNINAQIAEAMDQLRATKASAPELGQKLSDLYSQRSELELKLLGVPLAPGASDDRLAHLDSLQSLLPADAVLLDFFVFDEYDVNAVSSAKNRPEDVPANEAEWPTRPRMLVFAVTRNPRKVQRIDVLDPEGLERKVAAWRDTMVGERAHPLRERKAVVELADALCGPLMSHINGKKRILVSPAGPLNGVPLAALPDPGDPRKRLIERDEIEFSVVPSASFLVQRRAIGQPQKGTLKNLLFLDAPNFGPEKGNDSFSELKPAADLKQGISNTWPGQFKPLIGSDATKANLLELASRQDVIYVRTHHRIVEWPSANRDPNPKAGRPYDARSYFPGFFAQLALASANDGPPGILTGLEGADMSLSAWLVVLQACSSAEGDFASIVGMQQAFQAAGARAVAGTAWEVEEGTAGKVGLSFLRGVIEGQRPSKALADAQRQHIKDTKGKSSGDWCYFWGAWTVTDDLMWTEGMTGK